MFCSGNTRVSFVWYNRTGVSLESGLGSENKGDAPLTNKKHLSGGSVSGLAAAYGHSALRAVASFSASASVRTWTWGARTCLEERTPVSL